MMTPVNLRHILRCAVLGAALLGSASCASDYTRQGQSPSFLIIDQLTAASGVPPSTFSNVLLSDVQTYVNQVINGQTTRVPTVYNDSGRVNLRMGLKNPGPAGLPTTPTTINEITVTRFHVKFRRSDGREVEGVNVPYAFDGAATITVGTTIVSLTFDLVRHNMKEEPPLRNLIGGGGAGQINCIADITFYGHDQAGNEVSVMGQITVSFGDFGDP